MLRLTNLLSYCLGSEVAAYTAQHFPEFLRTQITTYKDNKLQQALEDGFLQFDEHLKSEHVLQELKEIAGDEDSEDDEFENGGK